MELDLSVWKFEFNMDFYFIIVMVYINDFILYVFFDLGFFKVNNLIYIFIYRVYLGV